MSISEQISLFDSVYQIHKENPAMYYFGEGCEEGIQKSKEALEYLHKVMVERQGYEPEDYFQIGAAIAANAGPKVVGVGLNRKK